MTTQIANNNVEKLKVDLNVLVILWLARQAFISSKINYIVKEFFKNPENVIKIKNWGFDENIDINTYDFIQCRKIRDHIGEINFWFRKNNRIQYNKPLSKPEENDVISFIGTEPTIKTLQKLANWQRIEHIDSSIYPYLDKKIKKWLNALQDASKINAIECYGKITEEDIKWINNDHFSIWPIYRALCINNLKALNSMEERKNNMDKRNELTSELNKKWLTYQLDTWLLVNKNWTKQFGEVITAGLWKKFYPESPYQRNLREIEHEILSISVPTGQKHHSHYRSKGKLQRFYYRLDQQPISEKKAGWMWHQLREKFNFIPERKNFTKLVTTKNWKELAKLVLPVVQKAKQSTIQKHTDHPEYKNIIKLAEFNKYFQYRLDQLKAQEQGQELWDKFTKFIQPKKQLVFKPKIYKKPNKQLIIYNKFRNILTSQKRFWQKVPTKLLSYRLFKKSTFKKQRSIYEKLHNIFSLQKIFWSCQLPIVYSLNSQLFKISKLKHVHNKFRALFHFQKLLWNKTPGIRLISRATYQIFFKIKKPKIQEIIYNKLCKILSVQKLVWRRLPIVGLLNYLLFKTKKVIKREIIYNKIRNIPLSQKIWHNVSVRAGLIYHLTNLMTLRPRFQYTGQRVIKKATQVISKRILAHYKFTNVLANLLLLTHVTKPRLKHKSIKFPKDRTVHITKLHLLVPKKRSQLFKRTQLNSHNIDLYNILKLYTKKVKPYHKLKFKVKITGEKLRNRKLYQIFKKLVHWWDHRIDIAYPFKLKLREIARMAWTKRAIPRLFKARYRWHHVRSLYRFKVWRKFFKRQVNRFRHIKKHRLFINLFRGQVRYLTGYSERQLAAFWYKFRRGSDRYWGSANLVQRFSQAILLMPHHLALILDLAPTLGAARALVRSGGLVINGQTFFHLGAFATVGDIIQINPKLWHAAKRLYFYNQQSWAYIKRSTIQSFTFLQADWSMLMFSIVSWPRTYELIAPSWLSERWIRFYIRQFPVRARKFQNVKLVWRNYPYEKSKTEDTRDKWTGNQAEVPFENIDKPVWQRCFYRKNWINENDIDDNY